MRASTETYLRVCDARKHNPAYGCLSHTSPHVLYAADLPMQFSGSSAPKQASLTVRCAGIFKESVAFVERTSEEGVGGPSAM